MSKNIHVKSKSKVARGRASGRKTGGRRVKYTDEPIKLGKTVPDFLPPPEALRLTRRDRPHVTYDASTDTLTLRLSGRSVAESDEQTPGLIFDYDDQGRLVGIELLNVSELSDNPRSIEVTVNG